MTEDQIKHMVDRFLNWKLPEHFNPDGGVSFEPFGNAGTPHQYERQPFGTNLLDATQADAMVRHMIEGMPGPSEPSAPSKRDEPVATLAYTNYRGETSTRRIIPKSVRYGSTPWHPEPQWLLLAWDDDKQADREFALKDFAHPRTVDSEAIKAANRVRDLIADLQGEHEVTTGPFDASKWKIEVPVTDLQILTSAIAQLVAGER